MSKTTHPKPLKHQVLRINGHRFVFLECVCGRVYALDMDLPKPQKCSCKVTLRWEAR
jgi:hypothetical protein